MLPFAADAEIFVAACLGLAVGELDLAVAAAVFDLDLFAVDLH